MASFAEVTKLKLNNGLEMPALGLGTYLGFENGAPVSSVDKQVRNIVCQAIDIGYRHFDTAAIYGTELEVGEGIRMKINQGVVKREDLFVTTKLWNTDHEKEKVLPALNKSLTNLGLEYVDLYLIHWPLGLNANSTFSAVDFMDTWKVMEEAYSIGLVKNIGLSNFNIEQIKRVLNEGNVTPSALQIEVHPQIVQKKLVHFAQSHGIVVTAYSPFGSLVRRFGTQPDGPTIDDPTLKAIADKYNKTTPQIVLRWLVDRHIAAIPKTTSPKRLRENIDIFDFRLTEQEIGVINSFDENKRYTLPSFWQDHPYYPFEKVDNPISILDW